MANITVWSGYRSFTGYSDCENIEFEGEEIGAVRYTDEGNDIQYRIYRTEDGDIVIHNVVRNGYEATGDIDVYANLEDAAGDYEFILRKAGIV